MHIIGGVHKGARLTAPKGRSIRPTSARTREAVFNLLAHSISGFSLDGARVIDLFAGTGALGLEAMSRGAGFCLFVENDTPARALIRENVEQLDLMGHTKIFRRDATRLGPAHPRKPFNLALADPPYDKGLGEQALNALVDGGWLATDAIVVLEERGGAEIETPSSFECLDQRRHGEAQTILLRYG